MMLRVAAAAALALVVSLSVVVASKETATTTYYSPARISYADLVKISSSYHDDDDDDASNEKEEQQHQEALLFLSALQDVGMISITDIPHFFGLIKLETLSALRDCIDSESSSSSSSLAAEESFPDGTVRRTIASHCVAGKAQKIQHNNNDEKESSEPSEPASCSKFDEASHKFREIVAEVTDTLATSLGVALLDVPADKTLLNKSADDDSEEEEEEEEESSSSYSLVDVIQQGEHLEHFHSYHKSGPAAAPLDDDEEEEETIEWHLDQGLALVFTPGLISNTLTDGFYIRLKDGSNAQVLFEEKDELVVMLGDGVNQYVNPILGTKLRAVPHSLRMPSTTGDASRVWYGRMVLPPPNALHPVHQETFGDLRNAMINDSGDQDKKDKALDLGCSSTLRARDLQDGSCAEGEFFCWHRCFEHSDTASPEACAAQNLDLACINEERQLWDGIHDAKFGPGCVDLDTAVPYERVPDLSQNETTNSTSSPAADDNSTSTNGDGDGDGDGDDHSDHNHGGGGDGKDMDHNDMTTSAATTFFFGLRVSSSTTTSSRLITSLAVVLLTMRIFA